MFTEPTLRVLYQEYRDAWVKGEDVPYTEIMRRSIAQGLLANTVGSMIAYCTKIPPSYGTIRQNADVVIADYRREKLRTLLKSAEPGADVDDYIRKTVISLTGMLHESPSAEKTIGQIAKESEGDYFKPRDNPRMELGFKELDNAIGGIDGGDVVLIAARPAVGKSAFALQVMRNLSREGKKIAYYNLEMREAQIYERMLASESGLMLNRIRLATGFNNDEEKLFRSGNEKLKAIDNIVIFSGSRSVADIKGEGFDVVIIDYLQLLRSDGKRGGNRYAEVGDISRGIKAIAVDNNIPVIALSQLNRVSESKSDKEPMMSDLRESGDLEQDASVILMLWNPNNDDKSEKAIKVEKARHGTQNKISLYFDGKHMKFKEVEDGFKETDDTPFD